MFGFHDHTVHKYLEETNDLRTSADTFRRTHVKVILELFVKKIDFWLFFQNGTNALQKP